MSDRAPDPPGAAELDALRRRLYRSGATEEDRQRYESLRDRLDPPSAPQAGPVEVPRRRRPWAAPAVVAAVAVVTGVAAAISIPQRSASVAPATRSAEPTPHPDPSRATPIAVRVRDGTRTAQRFHGVGSAGVPLITAGTSSRGGRLFVVLSSDDGASLGWSALRWHAIGSGPSTPQVVADSPQQPRTGSGRLETARYDGGAPVAIAVSDRGAHAWTLTVLLLDRAEDPDPGPPAQESSP